MGNELRGIISFDNSKLEAEQAKIYPTFSYEYDPSGASGSNGLLDEITKKNEAVSAAIDTIIANFNQLKRLYDDFSDFEGLVDSNMNKLDSLRTEIVEDIKAVINESVNQVNQAAANDATLAADLDSLGWNK